MTDPSSPSPPAPACGAERSPDQPTLLRTDTPPAGFLDFLDRQFTMLGTSLTAVRNLCLVLVAIAVVLIAASHLVPSQLTPVRAGLSLVVTVGAGTAIATLRRLKRKRVEETFDFPTPPEV